MNGQTHLDTGARALDALSAVETAAFDAHLSDCLPCTAEYREFSETVALLGAAVAIEAPTTLHRSLMRLVDITPQTPPAVGRQALSHGVPSRHHRAMRRRWFRRPPTLLAVTALAVLAVLGGILIAVRGSEVPPTAQQCVERAADAKIIAPTVGSGGSARYAPSCSAAVVSLPTMPALPAGSAYQVWAMADSAATSAGVVSAAAPGSGVVVPLVPDDTAIGVSIEPAGGSLAPTTDPVWVVPLHP